MTPTVRLQMYTWKNLEAFFEKVYQLTYPSPTKSIAFEPTLSEGHLFLIRRVNYSSTNAELICWRLKMKKQSKSGSPRGDNQTNNKKHNLPISGATYQKYHMPLIWSYTNLWWVCVMSFLHIANHLAVKTIKPNKI